MTERKIGADGKPIPTADEIMEHKWNATTAITRFHMDMHAKLEARSYKPHWRIDPACNTPEASLRRLREELAELEEALKNNDVRAIQMEAVDVANIALIVHDLTQHWIELRNHKDKKRIQSR